MAGRRGRSGRRRSTVRAGMWVRLCMTPPLVVWVVGRVPGTNGRRWLVSNGPDDRKPWEEPRRFLSPLPSSQLAFSLG